jgi:hypothetical protein
MKVNGQLHALSALPLAEAHPLSIDDELGRVPEPVWMVWRRDKSLAPAENRIETLRLYIL